MDLRRRGLFNRGGCGGAERRATCRYVPANRDVTMGWWKDGVYHAEPCLLLDFSMGGMGIKSAVEPTGAAEVGIKTGLGDDSDQDWQALEVVHVRPLGRKGPYKVHLRFRDSCPYDLFKRVMAGEFVEARPTNAAPEFDARYWR